MTWPLQTQDEVIVQTPEITQQVHYATDEEKLASTGLIGQTGDSRAEDVEPKGNLTAPGKKQPIKGTSDMKGVLGWSHSSSPCAELAGETEQKQRKILLKSTDLNWGPCLRRPVGYF